MQGTEAAGRWHGVVAQAEDGSAAQPELSESAPRRIPAILYPTTLAEVRQIVDEARARGTPLYPVSTGMNWGLGSRHPVRDDCVLVDLRRLDSIREVDLAHGYAIIEAGVSQHALAQRRKPSSRRARSAASRRSCTRRRCARCRTSSTRLACAARRCTPSAPA